MKRILIPVLIIAGLGSVNSQVIFTESFTVILDSSRVRGSITPEIRIRTQKKVLTEIDNLADISIRVKNSHLTFANRIEFSQYGDELALSGGYVYAEFRNFADKIIVPEYHGQVVYDHPRGLQIKYAGGVNARFKVFTNNNTGVFMGLGPFYEYEKWDYSGVPDGLVPVNPEVITTSQMKIASYLNYKQSLFNFLNVDLSGYYQDRINKLFTFPRFASSLKVGIQFAKHIEFLVMYQSIYDFDPVVPISNWYHDYYATISINF